MYTNTQCFGHPQLVIGAFISSLQVFGFDAVNKLESFLSPVSQIYMCVYVCVCVCVRVCVCVCVCAACMSSLSQVS